MNTYDPSNSQPESFTADLSHDELAFVFVRINTHKSYELVDTDDDDIEEYADGSRITGNCCGDE